MDDEKIFLYRKIEALERRIKGLEARDEEKKLGEKGETATLILASFSTLASVISALSRFLENGWRPF